MVDELPKEAGDIIEESRPIVQTELAASRELARMLEAHSMYELRADYSFFSVAPWTCMLGLKFDPIADYVAESPEFAPIAYQQVHRPIMGPMPGIVAGAEDNLALRCCIWICPKEDWSNLGKYLANVHFSDSANGVMLRAHRHDCIAPDWLYEEHHQLSSPFGSIPFTIFGLDYAHQRTSVPTVLPSWPEVASVQFTFKQDLAGGTT